MNALEIPNIDLNKELSKCNSMEDLVGKNGLMQRLFGGIIQQFLEAEMEEHLGRDRYERQSDSDKNYRNGHSSKNIKTSFGEVEVDVPRDRHTEFEPKIVKKYETVCNELDKKVIGLYARGMSVDDIKSEIDELYGVNISPSMISKITDKVMDTATAWQNRALDPVYPIVYMDAVHFKVRDDHRIVSKAAYVCMALDMKCHKDILLACMDGLKGLPDAIKVVFPEVNIQSCVIHQIRNTIKYIASKDLKAFMKDLKAVYQAVNETMASQALQSLEATWGAKYPIVIQSWNNNWENLSTYFDFPPEIRKIIYTTNVLEGFNRQLRKFTKIRTVFPTDDSLRKALYLATEQIMLKWTAPRQNWFGTLAQLSIMFEDRLEQYV